MAIKSFRKRYPEGDSPHEGIQRGGSTPAYSGNDFANEVASAPKSVYQDNMSANKTQRYQIHGGGGDYLHVTPTGDGKHDINRYGSKGEIQYQTKGAGFGHNAETGEVSWGGGKDHLGMGGEGKLKMSSGPYDV